MGFSSFALRKHWDKGRCLINLRQQEYNNNDNNNNTNNNNNNNRSDSENSNNKKLPISTRRYFC